MCEREIEYVCVCVRESERERGESMCVRDSMCVCERVYVCERECACVCV